MTTSRSNGSERTVRCLYIDDDRELLELTRSVLESRRPAFDVETTPSPREGLRMLEERDFDAVVCDYQMPELDGLAVLESIRSRHGDDVPFVMFTGKGRREVAIDALNLGADRYVRKGGDPSSQHGALARAIEQEVEHDRTRRQLHRRDENLRIVLESIGDAVITTDVEGRVTRMNPVAEELTGWTTAEAVGRPLPNVFEIVGQEDREPEEDPARRVIERGETVGLANGTILIDRDGSERYVADSAAPIEDGDGDLVGVVIVFRDVTDGYRSRERARKQRRAIVDVSVDESITSGSLVEGARTITEAAAETLDVDRVGIWLFEDDNAVLRNVDLYERSTDAHESGRELVASEHPDYFDALETHRSIEAADARRDPRTAELSDPYLEPLGIRSLLDATLRSGGEVVGVVCHEHVGDRREWRDDERRFVGEIADQVLRLLSNARRNEYESTLKELHDIATDITTFDTPEDVCRRTIGVAETLLEFDRCVINLEEDGMLPIAAISSGMPPDGVTPMSVEEGIVGRTYRTGESILLADVREAEEANPQGPYRAALSIPIGDHGVFQTVSERTDAFDADDRELAELLVSHAAQALDQLEKERTLRRQNERLDEFASVVSHDLRNPLNVARGRLSLAREDCDSEHLDDVARAHDRMGTLIDDLLTLAREGRTAIETGPVDLGDAVETCRRTVDTADATLVADADLVVHADAGRLQQLLENLVRNAVEHAGPTVTIGVGGLDDGFYVEDDGPGIPPDRRGDVFDMGYSTAEGGTGFGLPIVERIADSHGWEVAVTEGVDGGVRVEISGVDVLDG
ncbi:GAF domain-containing protein [Halorarum salinum]|uniref:histidine kinase n=1 Tax=Halorarum salinum TaxID=2743089 RepID=A0A7D5LBS3_9EURY|nr:GAF domain-containing protein [Halobaculum salinum]QLG62771.1 GAF domain-containing protein [Halobaculum salinum]